VERILNSNFGYNYNECQFEIEEGEKYTPTVYTDFLTTGMTPVYQEITDRAKLKEVVNQKLAEYNAQNITMNIVMFQDAISYMIKIYRILRMKKGHALLVGEGGSGRHSLSKLAAFIAKYQRF
jgi:dynein heavy chain